MPERDQTSPPLLKLDLRAQTGGASGEFFLELELRGELSDQLFSSGRETRMVTLDLQVRVVISGDGRVSVQHVSTDTRGEPSTPPPPNSTMRERATHAVVDIHDQLAGGKAGEQNQTYPAAASTSEFNDAAASLRSLGINAPAAAGGPPPGVETTTTTHIDATITTTQASRVLETRLQSIGMLPSVAADTIKEFGSGRVADVLNWQDNFAKANRVANRPAHLVSTLRRNKR